MDIEKKKNLILESIKKINKIIANENKEFSKSKLTIEEVSCIWVINKQFYDDIIKGNFKSLRGIFCFDKNVAEYFKKIGFVQTSLRAIGKAQMALFELRLNQKLERRIKSVCK